MSDEQWMQRVFDLALLGQGQVSPNPLVGCVIVDDQGAVLGEGWHQQYGQAHAEVNAIAQVTDKASIREATVYVNLEPCSHFGKTPPCADMLVQLRPKRVVIANVDSNPLVAGKGIEKLRAAGVEITTGVLEAQGRRLNRRFFTFIEQQRPYIILKWAQTANGWMGDSKQPSLNISNLLARTLSHRWRTEEDAIMVGKQTALVDNPQLDARLWKGKNPLRIAIDRFKTLPPALHLFDQKRPTLVYTFAPNEKRPNLQWIQLPEENFWSALWADLHKRKVQSLIVEGGSQLLHALIEAGYWDEIRVFISAQPLSGNVRAPQQAGQCVAQVALENNRLEIWQKTTT